MVYKNHTEAKLLGIWGMRKIIPAKFNVGIILRLLLNSRVDNGRQNSSINCQRQSGRRSG